MYKNKTFVRVIKPIIMLILILLLITSCKRENLGITSVSKPKETNITKTLVTIPASIPTTTLPQRPKIKIFLLENVNTCIVGSDCTGSDCINIKNTATDDIVKSFNRNGLVGKAPEQLAIDERNSAYCLSLKFNQNEIDSVKNEVYSFRDKIIEYSQNRIIPDIQIIEISNGEGVELSQYGSGFWQWSANVYSAIKPHYSLDTDLMFVISNVKDPNKKVYFDAPICDGSIANTFNYGIGFTWIPIGKGSIGCANSLTFVHGFLHQLANVINKINPPDNFKSYETNNYEYSGQKLSCSTQFNGHYSYFPDADVAPLDPDFDSCKGNFGDNWIESYCADLVRKGFDREECNIRWDKHLLRDHFPSNYVIVGNSCRNNKQDFDETGVDIGGQCSIYSIQETPSKQIITSTQPNTFVPVTTSPTAPLIAKTSFQNCYQFDSNNNNLNEQKRINLVLVGLKYNSLEDFRKVIELTMDTQAQNNGLFSVEPFKSNRDKFNILFVNQILDLSLISQSNVLNLDALDAIKSQASTVCPYSGLFSIILTNENYGELTAGFIDRFAIVSFPYPIQGEASLNSIKEKNRLLLHEAGGHMIGALADEYLIQDYLPYPQNVTLYPRIDLQQCYVIDPNELPCYDISDTGRFSLYGRYHCENPSQAMIDRCNIQAPWHDLVGNGCGREGVIDCNNNDPNYFLETKCWFRRCSINSFGSVGTGFMDNSGIPTQSYGQNNERLICRKIRELTGSVGGICNNLCLDGCARGQKCISGVCQTFQ